MRPTWTYLIVPFLDGKRMGDGEPIAMDLEISRFAATQRTAC